MLCFVVKIRPYQLNDLEDTVQVWYQTWHQTFPYIQHPQSYVEWEARFHDELAVRANVWVAEVENRIVGFIVVMQEEQCLEQLFVDMAYQNQGIGSALLEKVKVICSQGFKLHTLQQNMQARAFYERHGCKISKLSTNTINGQPNVEYYWLP
ncbi:GNAT family N-acetyltransferase [Komarekiella sp. 'clone 1']|uniref:GNAT family N-acetyltransferase n=1 Tax=Komarekiella delphini-convector SJRDD-AB1 TaxID=2593771 RepID=A0AA40SY49_9NOST|nr:GNAT family N-acetyltransferase [Komarekiella delphini-convector]MBD6617391.1 GNAT family N-acetyltransferase [Komarekiella delphini-convector SJRDD-AB1]